MLNITISEKQLFSHAVDGAVLLCEHGFLVDDLPSELKNLFPGISSLLEMEKFTGKSGQSLIIPVSDNSRVMYVALVGMGKDVFRLKGIEKYRRSLGQVVRIAEKYKWHSLAIGFNDFGGANDMQYVAEQTAIALRMACYHFDTYISDDERKHDRPLDVTMCVASDADSFKKGIEKGMVIGHSVNQARYWIDLPPSTLTPPELADKASEIANELGLKVTIFNEEKINQMGMGGLAAVSRGSEQDCRLAILEYHTSKKDAPTIAYVGKGITYDSGGLSLKPPAYMETMKDDMSGAAAVISAMHAIAQFKPDVNVIALTPLAENLPSGSAAKPGDIVRFYNGKTAEVKNTDAEGRLVLADALAYAVKHYAPTLIIDVATLTGACMHALGPFYSGLFSEHEDVVARVMESSMRSGDNVWRLPLTDDYKKAIKTPVADICNIGSSKYYAGATTAACFLQNFVADTPWAHIDIAGTAFDVPDISYYRSGATGSAVRLLVDLAVNWKK